MGSDCIGSWSLLIYFTLKKAQFPVNNFNVLHKKKFSSGSGAELLPFLLYEKVDFLTFCLHFWPPHKKSHAIASCT